MSEDGTPEIRVEEDGPYQVTGGLPDLREP